MSAFIVNKIDELKNITSAERQQRAKTSKNRIKLRGPVEQLHPWINLVNRYKFYIFYFGYFILYFQLYFNLRGFLQKSPYFYFWLQKIASKQN